MQYEFYTEDGVFKLDYRDYLKRKDLMAKLADPLRMHLNLGLKILNFDGRYLSEHKNVMSFFNAMKDEQEKNPIRFFLPHCCRVDSFDESEAHQFINDRQHLWTTLLAGNQWGKTTGAFVKVLLTHGLIPCDKNWEVFRDHGIEYVKWSGPKEIIVAADEWSKHRETMWPKVMRMWLPRDEVGDKFYWNVPINTSGETIDLTCGSKIFLKCYKQNQQAFESRPFHGVFWDEIPPLAKVQGAEARFRTVRRITDCVESGWHLNAMSPIQMEGREDTGGQSFIYDLYTGENTMGLTTKFYQMNLHSAPDWCFPEIEKERIESEIKSAESKKDKKALSHLRARAYGEWQFTDGILFANFDERVHVIDDFPLTEDMTMMRSIDHGRANITCCLWIATNKVGDSFVVRQYNGQDKVISENTHEIIRLSRNELEELPRNPMVIYNLFRERIVGERTWCDIMDGRSYKNKDQMTRYNIGELYRISGLHRLQAAPVFQYTMQGIELIKQLFNLDMKRKHIVTGERGAPRLYIFRSCKDLIKEIKTIRDYKDDSFHSIDALAYAAGKGLRYMASCTIGDKARAGLRKEWVNDEQGDGPRARLYDKYTGRRLL